MKYVTEGYQPSDVLHFFEDIARIPRGSRNEKAVAQYIYDWGKGLGLDCYKDAANNVVIKKPGSKGCENLPPIMLQGHTDIVCVKLPESNHDFEKDPLPLYVKDGKLKSNGTTLGADNGNAGSYMMVALSRNDYPHPPLECVFTSGEEIGLLGAEALDKNAFSAKRMINMDAGGLDSSLTTVSCAGGLELVMTQKPIWQGAKGEFISLNIHGLKGGHSSNVDRGLGNAAKLMARIINHVCLSTKTVVAEIYGGDKMNAIISSCTAVISVADKALALAEIAKTTAEIKEELRVSDPGFVCDANPCNAPEKMLDDLQSKHLVQFVLTIPSTVRDMDMEIPGHILNSNNLGAVQLSDEEIKVWTLARSGEDSRQVAMGEELKALADVFGYKVTVGANFLGWKYNPNSALRAVHQKLFKEKFGKDLQLEATHGGLECGVFFGKEPEMDIITFGPQSDGAHTPEEYVILSSFKDMFEYLLAILEELTK
ncbi:MAG: beta-Ala-His dipeptidase [Oscillospiraceae bacterium]